MNLGSTRAAMRVSCGSECQMVYDRDGIYIEIAKKNLSYSKDLVGQQVGEQIIQDED